MRRRSLLNLALAFAVLGLAALLWFAPDNGNHSRPLTALVPSQINRVALHFADAPGIVLQRADNGWRLVAPVQAPADEPTVDQLLRVAGLPVHQQRPVAEVNLATVGLAQPQVTVTFNHAIPIALGDPTALALNRYARMGDSVYLVDSPNMRALDSEYANLVSRELLPSHAKITKLTLPGATITPTKPGGWAVSPASANRGADAAQATIDAWRYGRALWMKPASNKPAQGEVVIRTTNGRIVYQVVARKPQLILRRPDLAVELHVAANQAAPLLDMIHPLPPPELKRSSDIPLASPADTDPFLNDASHA